MPVDLPAILEAVAPTLAENAPRHDAQGTFVADNYALLAKHGVFSAAIPVELGGGGASHAQMCDFLRGLAHHCSSTALAVSMHQHPVCTNVWKATADKGGEQMLRVVAEGELVVVTTGGRDWMRSNGRAQRVDGGYRVWAKKAFASGSPAGALLVTSVPHEDPEEGPQVVHFGVSMATEGVHVQEVWDGHGMRGTGSHDLVLEGVFVPDAAVSLIRPRDRYHPVWNVVITVALPMFMAVYVGIAERAAALARERAARRTDSLDVVAAVGAMETELVATQIALREMITPVGDYRFAPSPELANAALIRKSLVTRSARATVEHAMHVVGGLGYFRGFGLERLARDVRAAHYHPLPEPEQQRFTGCLALGLDPVA